LKNKVKQKKTPKSKKIKTTKPRKELRNKGTIVVELKEALKNKGEKKNLEKHQRVNEQK
jgi:hypothetical protein